MTSDAFFVWVKRVSEQSWSERSDAAHASGVAAGRVPSQSTQWRPPWTNEEIADVEARFGVHFPSAYRAMLRVMGGTTAMQSVRATAAADGTTRSIAGSAPGWLDARFDEDAIRARLDALPAWLWPEGADDPSSGFVFPETFGRDPGVRAERIDAIARWLAEAPPVWPLVSHRYLVLDESSGSAPVLSIWHCNDTIVYGDNIEDFLLRELTLPRDDAPEHDRVPGWDVNDVPRWGRLVE